MSLSSSLSGQKKSRSTPSDIQAVRNGACSVDPELEAAIKVNEAIDKIRNGGPFSYPQDGTVWENRKEPLPKKPDGYYREYTVDDPSAPNRGARRLVVGDGGEMYYTDDHYLTFTKIQ